MATREEQQLLDTFKGSHEKVFERATFSRELLVPVGILEQLESDSWNLVTSAVRESYRTGYVRGREEPG